jgi:hypothetical protein
MYHNMRKWWESGFARRMANTYLLSDKLLSDEDLRSRRRPEVRDLIEEYLPLAEFVVQKYGKNTKIRLANRYYPKVDGWIGVRGRFKRVQITQGFENKQTSLTRLQMIQGGPVYPLAKKEKCGGKIVDVGLGISNWGDIVENWKSNVIASIGKKIQGRFDSDVLLVNIVTDCAPTARFNILDFKNDVRRRLSISEKPHTIELIFNYKYLGWV